MLGIYPPVSSYIGAFESTAPSDYQGPFVQLEQIRYFWRFGVDGVGEVAA